MEKTIVCFGDSNTHGYDAVTGGRFDENTRWTCLLAKFLGAGYRVIEEGLNGRTTVFDDPITEGLCSLPIIGPCLMSHEPIDLLVIMLGTNDTKDRFGCTPELIRDGLYRLIMKAKTVPAFRGEPNILILAPVPISRDYLQSPCAPVMGYACAEKSQKLPDLYAECAELTGCHFLRADDFAGVNDIDYMHLGKQDHFTLAKALAERIPAML